MKLIETLNYVVISIYIFTLAGLWVSHQNPNMILSPANQQQRIFVFQSSDLVFEPIETVKPEIFLTNLNMEIARSKSGYMKSRATFVYYYVSPTAHFKRIK